MSNDEYITKIISNEITLEELETDINNDKYKIKNLNHEEISKIGTAYSFMKLGHILNIAVIGNNLEIIKLILQKERKNWAKMLKSRAISN